MANDCEIINKIFLCEVCSVQNYGAFTQMPGMKIQGLIHRSQISNAEVTDANDVLKKGDRVWCKVISTNDGKIGLSMKVVDQGSGIDLDPNGVKMHQDEMKRKAKPPGQGKRAITLEAVLKTVCTKCKTSGHLASDCFQSPDGKKYDILPEEDDFPTPVPQKKLENEPEKTDRKSKKRKKEKKHKKDKKHKRRKYSDSSSTSSDESSPKKSKKSKKAKRKRRDSS